MSVPMTLSEVERRDARGQCFRRISELLRSLLRSYRSTEKRTNAAGQHKSRNGVYSKKYVTEGRISRGHWSAAVTALIRYHSKQKVMAVVETSGCMRSNIDPNGDRTKQSADIVTPCSVAIHC